LKRTLKYTFLLLVVVGIALGSFAGGFVTGHLIPFQGFLDFPFPVAEQAAPRLPTVSAEQNSSTPEELQSLFTPFWEAWTIVHENYVDQPVDDIALMHGAIEGMVDALGDRHSSYMDPEGFKQANEGLEGEYDGIGAYVDTTTEFLTITSPMPGSPAERAGLKPGDLVVAIDGEDMTGLPGEAVRQKIIGPAGTTVHLTVKREGESSLLEFEIVRERISMDSASGEMLEDNIAYIQVTTFGVRTTPELLSALKELMAQNPRGLILDLRNNGGGYLQTSVEVASQFVADGVVLYEQYGSGERKTYEVIPGGLATDVSLPLIVLINEGSASASEIVAGALQDLGRARLVGVTSFGKGSVQNWVELSDDNGAVRITIAKWLTPNERTIHDVGLTPDVEVQLTDEDFEADRDPQLDKAVELIMESTNP